MRRHKVPKSQSPKDLDPEVAEILFRPNQRKRRGGMDWDVWAVHDDGLEPWSVSAIRVAPVANRHMPGDLYRSIERYRAQLLRGTASDDDPVFDDLRMWLNQFHSS